MDYSQADLNNLIASISDRDGKMTNIHRYIGGHVCPIYEEPSPLQCQLMNKLGGLDNTDFSNTKLFISRIKRIAEEAQQKNCKLYVDAEQTYI